MERVESGGHDVPDDVIADRFPRCFANLKRALKIVDLTILVDSTGSYDKDGIVQDGRRHYIFGEIECGHSVRLERVLPRWYNDQSVAAEIAKSCAPKA